MNFKELCAVAMRKRAAAILTPEAQQAAMQPDTGMAPPPDAAGAPPMDPAAGGAQMPAQGASGPQGGMIPPEITNDQQFIQWLASQGVQFDPASGQFLGPDGQPIPAEMIMQAYSQFQQMMQAQGGAPADPAAAGAPPAGGMPPESAGGAPMPPGAGAPPPEADGMPAPGGGLPPEILNDQQFMQFMQEAFQLGFDPNSGMFIDPQSGQPVPPELIMQAYQQFQQQGGAGAGAPGEAAPAADGAGAPPAEGTAPGGVPADLLDKFQSMLDASMDAFTAALDKKLEGILDKVETLTIAVESLRDTDDARTKETKAAAKDLQDEIAAELQPVQKTASEVKPAKRKAPAPVNMFDLLAGK